MAKIATVFGGSGFIGRYVVRRLALSGWRVRAAVRRPNEALFLRTCGVPGQVEPVLANVRNAESVAESVRGCSSVINCVGILTESGAQTFAALHETASATIANAAASESVAQLVQISAIGANRESASKYGRSKARGEEAVASAFPAAVILRPSIVFGSEDSFFNRFAAMARLSPILPLVGAETRFQPVYVDDVAQSVEIAAEGKCDTGIYELGGPDQLSFRELMDKMLSVINRRRLIIDLPGIAVRPMARTLDILQFATGGVFVNRLLTADQIRQLERDNLVSEGASGLVELGIEPTAMDAILASYLKRFRPSGSVSEVREFTS